MKRILGCAGLIGLLALPLSINAQYQDPPPQAPAPQYGHYGEGRWNQNHGEFNAYGDLFRVTPRGGNAVNFVGLGGRIGFNVHPNIALEAEMSYDFDQNYTTVSQNGNTTGVTSTTITGRTRPIIGLFGPKFQFGTSGAFRAFVTGKVGFTEFSHSTSTASGTAFANSFDQFGGGSTHVAAYPGGGIEAFFGPLGIRAEAGDQIYWNNGTYNNLRVTFGPTLRF
jgi:opacity protein-like surface antigen